MKYCPKCGTQLSDEAQFCTKCGYKMPTIDQQVEIPNRTETDIVATEKPNNTGKIITIGIFIFSAIAIVFLIYSQSPQYRKMTTSEEQKTEQLVQWADENDITIGADVTLNGNLITLEPRDDSNLEEYFQYFYTYGNDSDDDAEIKDQMTKVSKHIQHEWGNGYTEELLNPENTDRMLVEAKDGKISYNVFD